jgi:hypothetical protein
MSITDKKQALSQGKPLGSSSKLPPPKKEKDTDAYYGDNRATHEENRKWLRDHANDVLKITRGRVKFDKIEEYEKTLSNPAKWGTSIEKSRNEPGRMKTAMTKEEDKAKPFDKFDKREDMEIARRMWGKK